MLLPGSWKPEKLFEDIPTTERVWMDAGKQLGLRFEKRAWFKLFSPKFQLLGRPGGRDVIVAAYSDERKAWTEIEVSVSVPQCRASRICTTA